MTLDSICQLFDFWLELTVLFKARQLKKYRVKCLRNVLPKDTSKLVGVDYAKFLNSSK